MAPVNRSSQESTPESLAKWTFVIPGGLVPLRSPCDPHELASWVKRIDGYRRRKALPPMNHHRHESCHLPRSLALAAMLAAIFGATAASAAEDLVLGSPDILAAIQSTEIVASPTGLLAALLARPSLPEPQGQNDLPKHALFRFALTKKSPQRTCLSIKRSAVTRSFTTTYECYSAARR